MFFPQLSVHMQRLHGMYWTPREIPAVLSGTPLLWKLYFCKIGPSREEEPMNKDAHSSGKS